jgi:ABC-type Fe3+ transport system substrate-binding protein
MQEYGVSWFDALLEQNPRWVRGIADTGAIARSPNFTEAAYFAASGGFGASKPLKFSQPKKGKYVSWAQCAAILKDAPHPEGAKLLHNSILSPEYQATSGTWSVRRDVPAPEGFPDLWNETATNPAEFARFMEDRALVERLQLWFEARIGVPRVLILSMIPSTRRRTSALLILPAMKHAGYCPGDLTSRCILGVEK